MKNLQNFYNILNTFEDYLSVGFKRNYLEPTHLSINKLSTDVKVEHNFTNETLHKEQHKICNMQELSSKLENCKDCFLTNKESKSIIGEGLCEAGLMIVSDSVLREDESFRRPYAASVGEFLGKWITAIGLDRYKDCYITYLVKCSVENDYQLKSMNKDCLKFFKKEVEFVKPKLILCLGSKAANLLINKNLTMGDLRKDIYEFEKIPLFVTFDPAIVIQNEEYKRDVWNDLKKIKEILSQSQNN